jgi:hypothetical protein
MIVPTSTISVKEPMLGISGRAYMGQFVSATVVFLAGVSISTASTVFSNFSAAPPGYVTDSYEMKLQSGFFGTQDIQWAMGFTVPSGSDFQFTGFIVPLTFSGTATTVDFTLASDADGTPGSALETIAVDLSNGTALYTGSSTLDPTLMGGTSYWLEGAISPIDLGTVVDWNAAAGLFSGLALGPTADIGTNPFSTNWSVSTATQAAFEIDGTLLSSVPEPRYGWLLVFGCLLAAATLRSRVISPYR